VRLLSGGGQVVDPVAVSFDSDYSYAIGGNDPAVLSVDPRFVADLRTGWLDMAAGIAISRDCSQRACAALNVDLALFFVAAPIKLTSPNGRPILVKGQIATFSTIDLPLPAATKVQEKLGLLSGSYVPPPRNNLWWGCFANSALGTSTFCPPVQIAERMPLNTAATRSFEVSVGSGSVLQLEVTGLLSLRLPASTTLDTWSGTMLLDAVYDVFVPAGTRVESGALAVTVVPEPEAWMLWLAGLALLGARAPERSRRRRPVRRLSAA
jgi:hypothetical protein